MGKIVCSLGEFQAFRKTAHRPMMARGRLERPEGAGIVQRAASE